MGLFGSLLRTTVHLATSPLDVVHDVVTLGGATVDRDSAIATKLSKLGEDVEDIMGSDEW